LTARVGWIDATGGVGGDMLLGACLDAGADVAVIQDAIDRLKLPEPITIGVERTQRGGLGAVRAIVQVSPATQRRTLADVLALLDNADDVVRDEATAVFRALAEAEARVHAMPIESVHFHEVGALDSIADVVGVIAGVRALGIERVVCSPIALGGGRTHTEHGELPIPGPAVVELLRARNAPAFGGPIETELATPTGVALLTTLADTFGPLPALRPELVGVGAGSKDPAGHANITRLIVGAPVAESASHVEAALVLEANVDDLDPRLWPLVLSELIAAGASDAWLTPIVMKKGRPAHTLSVLAEPTTADALQRLVFTHTSTIGLRVRPVDKIALSRESISVDVFGHAVRVKIARLDDAVVNAVPEYDDIARVAEAENVPAKVVLDAARAAAARTFGA
jgi:uncharacterized protein (TIGR00299 family) protein